MPVSFSPTCARAALVLSLILLPAMLACTSARVDPARRILEAARAGDTARVEALLDADPALLGARDGDGRTPLYLAVLPSRST